MVDLAQPFRSRFRIDEPEYIKDPLNVLKSCTLHALPEMINHEKKEYKIRWGIVFVASLIGCAVHMFFLLHTFFVAPNQTSISYVFEPNMPFPSVTICPFLSRFLDAHKWKTALDSGNSSINQLYALEFGAGIVNLNFWKTITSLNMTEVAEEYDSLIAEHGNIANATREFYANYGVTCEELFKGGFCRDGYMTAIDCCTIFQPYFSFLGGQCFAVLPNTLITKSSFSLGSLRIHLEIPQQLEIRENWIELADGSYALTREGVPMDDNVIIGVNDGLDQSAQWPAPVYLHNQEFVFYLMKRKRRLLMSANDNCNVDPELHLFKYWTVGNCGWEKNFFEQLHLLNVTCEHPLPGVINPSLHLTNACSLSEMLKLHNLTQTSKYYLNIDGIWQVLSRLSEQNVASTTRPCQFPCDYTDTMYTINKGLAPVTEGVMIQLQYQTNEIEVVEEVPRQSFSEYWGLIGGNLGLWTGASLISLGHLCCLIYRAIRNSWRRHLLERKRRKTARRDAIDLAQLPALATGTQDKMMRVIGSNYTKP